MECLIMYESLPESSAAVCLLCSNILIGTHVSNTLVYAIPLLNVRAKKHSLNCITV
jgi:hypothetical protein